jgi:sugar/nucleoside kinase (ribokinase family)
MKITIFGDVMRDYRFEKHPTLPVECNAFQLGGTLLNMCIAAQRCFDKVIAVGAVGSKDRGQVIQKFEDENVEAQIKSVSGVSTGVCLLLYENGIRTGILSLRQANLDLNYGSVDMSSVLSSDFLFLNGWSFLPESRTSRTLVQILAEANSAGIPIIFDLLPHHIQWDEMNKDYLRALELCSIAIVETKPKDDDIARVFDVSRLRDMAKKSSLFLFFDWIHTIRVETKSGECLADEPTNYTPSAPRGFLDEVALRQVLKFYSKKDI